LNALKCYIALNALKCYIALNALKCYIALNALKGLDILAQGEALGLGKNE
jgi:hypothetical protein